MRRLMPGHSVEDQNRSALFDGKSYTGFAGDTLASALIANGVHLTGRSFKYHRPRGIIAAGSEEPNALVRVGKSMQNPIYALPRSKSMMVKLLTSQNRFPSLKFDFGAINSLLGRFFPQAFITKPSCTLFLDDV